MRTLFRLGYAAAVLLVAFFILHGFVSWQWAAGIGCALAVLHFLRPYIWARLVLLKDKVFG